MSDIIVFSGISDHPPSGPRHPRRLLSPLGFLLLPDAAITRPGSLDSWLPRQGGPTGDGGHQSQQVSAGGAGRDKQSKSEIYFLIFFEKE